MRASANLIARIAGCDPPDVIVGDRGWFRDWQTGTLAAGVVVALHKTAANRVKAVSVRPASGRVLRNLRRDDSPRADRDLPVFSRWFDDPDEGYRHLLFVVGALPVVSCPECRGSRAAPLFRNPGDCRFCALDRRSTGFDLRGLRHR